MPDAERPRLLARERKDLDAVAEPLRERRRVVAFLVCPVELRRAVMGYLSEQSGRAVPEPGATSDAEGVLAVLNEAAGASEDQVRSLAVEATAEEAVRALNWHREKLRRGASVLVWMSDVETLRTVRRLAPDAYSFRDVVAAIEGERAARVVPPDVEHVDVRLARARLEAAPTPLDGVMAACELANVLRVHGATAEALRVLNETFETFRPAGGMTEEETVALAQVHLHLAAVLESEMRLVEAHRHVERGLALLQGRGGSLSRVTRIMLAAYRSSPLGPAHRALDELLGEARTADLSDLILKPLLHCAGRSQAARGLTRSASALLDELIGIADLGAVHRSMALHERGRLAMRAGRLGEAESLLREAGAVSEAAGAGSERAAHRLAECHHLQGEIALARRELEPIAIDDRGDAGAILARCEIAEIAVDTGHVPEAFSDLRACLDEAAASRRDGLLYEISSTYTECICASHDADRLSPHDLIAADTALRGAEAVAIAISGEDPPWYQALYPLLRARLLAVLPGRIEEALDTMRGALALCERRWSDAVPLLARTLTMHLVKAGRHEEALSVIERATPQMVSDRFLEELARIRSARVACLAHLGAPASDIGAAMESLRATFAEMAAPRITADTLLTLSLLLPPDGTSLDALPLLEEAQELFADMPIVAKEARCLEAMGDVLLARGNPGEARSHHRTAKSILERHGLRLRTPLLERKLGGARE